MLTLSPTYIRENGAIFTATEIEGQPELWNEVLDSFTQHQNGIHSFLQDAYKEIDTIVLTGAGTSAFIGLSLQGTFFRNTKIITRAIATTDIVSNPQDYFSNDQTSLIISFARSGNSPESYAALELAGKFSRKCFHLIITCDENGDLAKYNPSDPVYVFVLPGAANDKSLAMTGSYSAMLLTGLLIACIHQPKENKQQVKLLTEGAKNILASAGLLNEIARKDFKRAMFLGSGALFGTATESALKLQELTDGKVICKSDTYLGLRHGPKAVIDDKTLVVYFLSNDNYVNRYEHDLVNAMKDGNNAMYCLAVTESYELVENTNGQISFGINGNKIKEDFLPVCSVLVGQLLGFYKSLQLGLTPDSPSVNGAISRVVQGVNIYPIY